MLPANQPAIAPTTTMTIMLSIPITISSQPPLSSAKGHL
jgi:hypothetical protein